MKKVLVINSQTSPLSQDKMAEIRQVAQATEDEVVVVDTPQGAFAAASAYRATLKLIIVVAGWSELLINRLYDCIHGTSVRILAVCANFSRRSRIMSICHSVVDSVEKLPGALSALMTAHPAGAATS